MKLPVIHRNAGTAGNLITTLLLLLGLNLICTPANAQLVVVVHENNPLAALKLDEVRQIFLGRLQLFPGTNTSVQVLDQDDASTVFADFYEQVANKNATQMSRYRASFLFGGRGRLPAMVNGDQGVLEALQKNKSAIGYVQRESVTGHSVKVVLDLQ